MARDVERITGFLEAMDVPARREPDRGARGAEARGRPRLQEGGSLTAHGRTLLERAVTLASNPTRCC